MPAAAPTIDPSSIIPADSPATQRKKGALHALRSIGNAIKRSPKIVRKAFGSQRESKDKRRLKVGKGKDFSELNGCQDNGWLYKDSDVIAGVNYKVKYLGSVEVDFDPTNTTNNQEHAQKAMRALRTHSKQMPGSHPKLELSISVANMQLSKPDGTAIMRHSTTRIAYSTVDVDFPKMFAYVAMVKGSKLTLAHIFKCKSAKQGYEMTFVAAQGFDLNYRGWQTNHATAMKAAKTAEGGDVEPTKAWQKKKDPAEAAKEQDRRRSPSPLTLPPASADARASPVESSVSDASSVGATDTQLSPRKGSAAKEASPSRDPIFLAIQEGQDPATLAAEYFAKIGVVMIEDDDDEPNDMVAPNLFEIGVDTSKYNEAAAADETVGYMTIGAGGFADDVDDDEDF